ncbi:MAG TPA: hypothetical protein VNB23_04100, partial [Ramlibacter sp.]|nr:hypothetical protein [Ramlibacter sp.]
MTTAAPAQRRPRWPALLLSLLLFATAAGPAAAQPAPANPAHTYPPELAAALLQRKLEERKAIAATPMPAAFAFVASNHLWPSGQRLIVAFHGGHYEVWRDIAAIANKWSTVANVTFDFGLDPANRTARMWHPSDPPSAAHVRIRLDVDSPAVRYAAVGREAFLPEFAAGSLVLGGLVFAHPLWSAEDRADILHEFGHVLGFLHEQQRPECHKDLRLEPGPGGEPSIYQVYEKLYNWELAKTRANLLLAETY